MVVCKSYIAGHYVARKKWSYLFIVSAETWCTCPPQQLTMWWPNSSSKGFTRIEISGVSFRFSSLMMYFHSIPLEIVGEIFEKITVFSDDDCDDSFRNLTKIQLILKPIVGENKLVNEFFLFWKINNLAVVRSRSSDYVCRGGPGVKSLRPIR